MPDFILQYGPIVPAGAINLAFFKIPVLTAGENASVIATARYLPANQLGITKLNTIASIPYVHPWSPGTFSITLNPDPADNTLFPLTMVNQPIELLPPVSDDTGTWKLRVRDGAFTRVVTLDEREADFSWLYVPVTSGGAGFAVGDVVALFYTLPEYVFAPYLNQGIHQVQVNDEVATLVDDHTILLNNNDILSLLSVTVSSNGPSQTLFSVGSLLNEIVIQDAESGTLITSLVNSTVTPGRALSVNDEVHVSYTYRAEYYEYPGYCDDQGIYHTLDLNPSEGHYFDTNTNPIPTSELLNTPIWIYLLPSAAMKIGKEDDYGNVSPATDFTVRSLLKLKSFPLRWQTTNYGNPNGEYYSDDQSAHFGYARFDRDSYSARQSSPQLGGGGGVNGLSNSAVLLGEVYIGPNSTIDSVNILDTRSRGGGIPEDDADFIRSYTSVSTNRVDDIAGYWDTSGWSGQAVMLDGVVVVTVPAGIKDGTNGYPLVLEEDLRKAIDRNIGAGIFYTILYQ